MNSIFEANMKYLKENYKEAYELIKNKGSEEESENEGIEIFSTKNDLINFRIKTENAQFYLHSQYDPVKEGLRIINIDDLEKYDSLYILGYGLGYHLIEISNFCPNKNKIIIEPDVDIFYKTIKYVDITDILGKPNTFLYLGKSEEEIGDRIRALYENRLVYSATFLELPSYLNTYGDYWNDIQKRYTKFITSIIVNVNTINLFKDLWVENFFKSFIELPNEANINCFLNKFEGIPAIIMASGPSLSKNIGLVKDLQDKAVLVAAGSAISAVEMHGVTPHFMISIDGLPLMSEIYNSVKCKKIIFGHTLTTHYDCVRKYKGPKMYIRSSSEGTLQLLEEHSGIHTPQILTGGSCANLALDFVKNLGCSPIILIGQDLAYTDMVTHTDGIVHKEDAAKYDKKKFVEMKDMYGNITYTTHSLLQMKIWFETYLEAYKDINVINATEGGLSINGTKEMSLKDVIDSYCKSDNNIRRFVKKGYKLSFEDDKNIYKYNDLLDFLEYMKKGIEKLKKASKYRINKAKLLYNKVSNSDMTDLEKNRKLMDKKTRMIENDKIYIFFIRKIVDDLNYIEKNNVEQLASKESLISSKLNILYNGLITQYTNAQKVIDKIEECIESTKEEIETASSGFERGKDVDFRRNGQ